MDFAKLDKKKPRSRQSISVAQALRSRAVLLLTTAAFLQYFIGYSVIFWLPTILKNQSGLSDTQVRSARRGALRCGALCDALQRMAFDRNRERRCTLRPTLDCRNRLAVPHQSAQLECNDYFTVERHLYGHGISAGFWAIPTEILSDSKAAVAVNDQRACQPGRFCRTVRVRISPR